MLDLFKTHYKIKSIIYNGKIIYLVNKRFYLFFWKNCFKFLYHKELEKNNLSYFYTHSYGCYFDNYDDAKKALNIFSHNELLMKKKMLQIKAKEKELKKIPEINEVFIID